MTSAPTSQSSSDTPAESPPDPVALVDSLASGFQEAQIVMTALRLGVFEALDAPGARSEGLDAPGLAEHLGADRRGIRILCDALAALGVLDKESIDEGGRYRNGAPAREALLPDAPRSKVAMLLHRARLYERWAKLIDAVVGGVPVPDDVIDPRLDSDERAFARAMADVARDSAVQTADALERAGALAGVESILDVGGGPGRYAIELARRADGARATVLDRPETLAVAREAIAAAGMADRITTRPGDAYAGDLASDGGPYDLIFTSNLIHIYPAEANRRLVRDAARALAPGGLLAIKDFLLEADRTRPEGAALFAVNMLVSTEGGDCYTVDEVADWFREAGLEPEATVEVTAKSRVTTARKP